MCPKYQIWREWVLSWSYRVSRKYYIYVLMKHQKLNNVNSIFRHIGVWAYIDFKTKALFVVRDHNDSCRRNSVMVRGAREMKPVACGLGISVSCMYRQDRDELGKIKSRLCPFLTKRNFVRESRENTIILKHNEGHTKKIRMRQAAQNYDSLRSTHASRSLSELRKLSYLPKKPRICIPELFNPKSDEAHSLSYERH